jgi:hypothetical protein
MQSVAWALLLRQYLQEQQNSLMLVTAAGTEIAVQQILRLDHEFVAIRGRMAGSTDAGRVFIIPYRGLLYVGTQQACTEADFRARFDNVSFPDPSAPAEPPAPAAEEPPPPAEPEEAAVAPSARAPAPIKSAVLERFRARSASAPGVSLRPSGVPEA